MQRRSFLGILGSAIGIYATEPTLAALPQAAKDEFGVTSPHAAASAMQSFVLRNDSDIPMVIAYKSARVQTPEDVARRRTYLSSAERILESRPYQTEAILLPGEELTITAAPMRGLDPLTPEDKHALLKDGSR